MAIIKITDQAIRRLPTPKKGKETYYDANLRGFGVNKLASGRCTFTFRYKTKTGRAERVKIGGNHPDWNAAEARAQAKRVKRLVDADGDPARDLREKRTQPTVDELCDRFLKEVLPRRKPSTQHTYRLQIQNVIKPELGRLRVGDVAFADLDRLHQKITARGRPYRANRVLALVSAMFGFAVKWKWVSDNPCIGVERNSETKRVRYLTFDELTRLGEALPQLRDRQSAAIIGLALLTGARRGEILHMRWENFDEDFTVWSKPASTTKTKILHTVPLTAPARQLLLAVRGAGRPISPWVFPGAGGVPRKDVREAWARVCELASIKHARFHDLRHTFASLLASSGFNLPIIGQLLGHSTPATTARYSHLYSDPLRIAADKVAEIVSIKGNGA